MFKKVINYLKNYDNLPKVKSIANPICIIVLLFTLFFGYVSNVKIDEGSEQLYKALDVLFVVFIILGAIAATILVTLIVFTHKAKKEYYQTHNKKKVRIYAFDVINFAWMALFCLCCIYPLYYVLIGSFNQGADYAKGGIYLLPRLFTFENYKVVLKESQMWHSYLVTFGRTIIGTLTALVFTSVVAYAMSRNNLKFKGVFYKLNIFTMFFGGGLIPYFLIIK